ncbi:MAG: phosphotransacetylase family protein, partial [Chloroflexi bacterium]
MTLAIYTASTQPHSGKTALCAGLLRRFQADKYRVGYMKPVSTGVRAAGQRYIGLDAHFIKYALGFPDNLDQMAPVLLTHDLLENAVSNGEQGLVDRVRTAYQAVSAHRDVVFLEGATHLREGRVINLEPEQVGQLFNARQLAVAPYQDTQQVIDDLLAARHRLGDSLVGVFINQTPEDRLEYTNTRIKPFLERRGVPVLAVLPQVNALRGASVAELADGLNGEILCCHHAVDQMVEHLMVGAMDAALAFNYFRRTPNKAVITSGDRLDLQLSALET